MLAVERGIKRFEIKNEEEIIQMFSSLLSKKNKKYYKKLNYNYFNKTKKKMIFTCCI